MSLPGEGWIGSESDKFEHVSSDLRQMSLAGGSVCPEGDGGRGAYPQHSIAQYLQIIKRQTYTKGGNGWEEKSN